MKFVLKKKNFFIKTKNNLHFVNKKTSKGKKKMKRNEMNKSTCTTKKNHIEKFETQNLRRGKAALVLVEDTDEQGRRQNVDVKV